MGRIEVWLFVAIAMIGLLGFMSTLTTGDVLGPPGGEESGAAIVADQE
jgi:hypothetical protein